jgi:hypothetical protein
MMIISYALVYRTVTVGRPGCVQAVSRESVSMWYCGSVLFVYRVLYQCVRRHIVEESNLHK